MAKKTKEETLITIECILEETMKQLLHIGYEEMSYTTLSEATGISRTGISHHFPKKSDFTMALKGRIFHILFQHLDTKGSLQEFEDSWKVAINNSEFIALITLIFHQLTSHSTEQFGSTAIEHITSIIVEIFGDDATKCVDSLLGFTLSSLASDRAAHFANNELT